ncbi:Cytidine deaminase [hydrothermal vent metagenome]|uniref:cytidine deaminase n=1 Tax=hydrothermal vent metagenome TaxID=652676 RepID=A0A3B1C241_9ZZZZ
MSKDISVSDEKLVAMAKEAIDMAYAPYSKFRVAAALVTSKGNIHTGVNVENASYGLTVCAERVAVLKAVSCGDREIERIAVVSSSEGKVFPCGACRQVLSEFSSGDLSVIISDTSGGVTENLRLADLLPRAFGPEPLGDR